MGSRWRPAVGAAIAAVLAACTAGGAPSTTAGLFAADFQPISVEASCDGGGAIRRVSADNRLTVRFELCAPDVSLASKLASPIFGILPGEVLEEAAGDATLLDRPVGTGPYQFGAWEQGTELRFDRFERYRTNRAETETLVFRWDDDAGSRVAALVEGSVDGIDEPGSGDYATIAGSEELRLQPRPGINLTYLGFNTDLAPFDDVALRRAVALGLDRGAVVAEAFPPNAAASVQTLPPGFAGWTPTPEWPVPDPPAAADAIGNLGAVDAVPLAYPDTLPVPYPDPAAVAAAVQVQLEALGLAVELAPMAPDAFAAARDAGDLPLFVDTWVAATPEVGFFFEEVFMSDRFGSGTEPIREAIEAAYIGDPDQRYLANEWVLDAAVDTAPLVPIGHVDGATAFREDVIDLLVIPFGLDSFEPLATPSGIEYFHSKDPGGRDTFVWMQAREPEALYCADAQGVDTLRACAQILETMVRYEVGDREPEPGVVETWSANEDATVWTFRLLDEVEFHDGSDLDAADVVKSFAVLWDAGNELHVGDYEVFRSLFGAPVTATTTVGTAGEETS